MNVFVLQQTVLSDEQKNFDLHVWEDFCKDGFQCYICLSHTSPLIMT